MTHKVLLLNGPPGCGKDTIATILYRSGLARHRKFADPIKRAVRELFNVPDNVYRNLEKIGSQQQKDESLNTFGSWRELCIWLAETTKAKFGQDIFGVLAAASCVHNITQSRMTVFSDCGFNDEIVSLAKLYKPENVIVWKIIRDGTSFQNDSRSYVTDVPQGVVIEEFHNIHELDMLEIQVMMRVRKLLGNIDDKS